jgi:hypothetical protein
MKCIAAFIGTHVSDIEKKSRPELFLRIRTKMLRFSVLVVLVAVAFDADALGQYGTGSLDSIARSLDDISNQMRYDSIDRLRERDRSLAIGDQLAYYRQLAATLNQQLNVVAVNANAAVSGWQKAELNNRRLMENNKKLEAEIARLKRNNREPEADNEIKTQFETYAKFFDLTTKIYATAIAEKRPDLIEKHVITFWQAGVENPLPNPRVEVRIFDAGP